MLLQLPAVSSAGAVEASLNGLLESLRTAAAAKLDVGPQCTVAHVLDGIFALAWSDPSNVRELGSTNVCTLLVGLLSCESVRVDPVLVEKGLQAAAALCRFRDDKSSKDTANIAALGEAGIFTGSAG